MNLCKLIKEQTKQEALFCLMPYNTLEGYTQVCTAITYRNIEINLLFFAEKYNIKCYVGFDKVKFVWNDNETQYFDCLTCREMGIVLYKANKEALLILLYALFANMRRTDAYADAYAAAYATADTAYAACSARTAYDACSDVAYADAAYASASTAAAYAAYASADAAYAAARTAYVACSGVAAAAAYAAYPAADTAYAARIEVRKVFRALIKLRKVLLKEGDEEHE